MALAQLKANAQEHQELLKYPTEYIVESLDCLRPVKNESIAPGQTRVFEYEIRYDCWATNFLAHPFAGMMLPPRYEILFKMTNLSMNRLLYDGVLLDFDNWYPSFFGASMNDSIFYNRFYLKKGDIYRFQYTNNGLINTYKINLVIPTIKYDLKDAFQIPKMMPFWYRLTIPTTGNLIAPEGQTEFEIKMEKNMNVFFTGFTFGKYFTSFPNYLYFNLKFDNKNYFFNDLNHTTFFNFWAYNFLNVSKFKLPNNEFKVFIKNSSKTTGYILDQSILLLIEDTR